MGTSAFTVARKIDMRDYRAQNKATDQFLQLVVSLCLNNYFFSDERF